MKCPSLFSLEIKKKHMKKCVVCCSLSWFFKDYMTQKHLISRWHWVTGESDDADIDSISDIIYYKNRTLLTFPLLVKQ